MNADFERYIALIAQHKARFQVDLYAYCLTPTTIHLIVYPHDSRMLSLFVQSVHQGYAVFFNGKYNGRGKVWGQRYKSIVINSDRGLFESIKSVEFIAVKEGLCQSVSEYPWSSYATRVLGMKGIVEPPPAEKVVLSGAE